MVPLISPRVFISYSHDSLEHADRVLTLANKLIQDGIDCILDQYEESPPEGWPKWMDKQIQSADFVLVICTETYYRRVMGTEEEGVGLGIRWEGTLTYQHLYDSGAENTRFIPILFQSERAEYIPIPLRGATHYYADTEQGYKDLYRRLTNQPKTIKPKLGKLRKLQPRARKQNFFATEVMLAKLPTTGRTLFGREQELAILDNAWADPHIHILSLVAWGGVGKTALVNGWLSRMELDNYRGTERIYGWSFYSQGTREDRQASADEFLAYALDWFGDPDPTQGSPWDKGVRLARLIRKQKTLLVLDGLEPLQYPSGELQGHLKDQGMRALLKELSHLNSGLCVITTRCQVEDIEHKMATSAECIYLENLSTESGAHLLKSLGVKGTFAELREASTEFGGHALALNLLGRYLATVCDGEIRKRDSIPRLTEEEEQGGHARRVMESYERTLAGTPELDILRLMGLFDRPAEGGTIEVLRAKPPIRGLTSELQKLSGTKWQYAVKYLRNLCLLSEKEESHPDTLDCHPLVREYFGEELRKNNPEAWKEAHFRLYEYYKKLPAKHLPDTLEEMEPLFAAVAHGCQAGRHQEALDKVYLDRIMRGNSAFALKEFGAYGAALTALSGFFQVPWAQPIHGLADKWQAELLAWSGFILWGLGRSREASLLICRAMNCYQALDDWIEAAKAAVNLSQLYLALGELKNAIDYARQSVDLADCSGDNFWKESSRINLANALFQRGNLFDASSLFQEAETIQKVSSQKERQPDQPYLYSVWGFPFCDLLLSQGQYREVQKRVSQSLKTKRTLIIVALDKVSLGRALMLRTQEERSGDFTQAQDYLNEAVEGLRKGSRQDYLPLGLLARAALYRVRSEFSKAWYDMEEVQEIAERNSMNLYLADYHLEACHLCLAEGNKVDARQHLSEARTRIDNMGYHRRDIELEELAAKL